MLSYSSWTSARNRLSSSGSFLCPGGNSCEEAVHAVSAKKSYRNTAQKYDVEDRCGSSLLACMCVVLGNKKTKTKNRRKSTSEGRAAVLWCSLVLCLGLGTPSGCMIYLVECIKKSCRIWSTGCCDNSYLG